MGSGWRGAVLTGAALLFVGVLGSCTDEEIVFRDRPLFDQPAAEALGFVGYTDAEEKLTVCGNCHVGQQSGWEQTQHADAWLTLEESGHSQPFCEGCHTVNELGNSTTVTGGYNAAPDERYHDVQCEACHGPGLAHVQNPDVDANHPQASIAVGLDLTNGCGECHSGTHHPFVEEWSESPHGTVNAYPAGRDGCNACHEGKGALRAWGVNNSYTEKNSAELLPITCAVCHDPHSGQNGGQLRFAIDTRNFEEHLCAQCHDRRTEPDPNSSHGLHPHSPETAMLQGNAGWFPPGALIEQGEIVSRHGSERNQGLCATCHVAHVEVNDAETGNFLIHSTGHLFKAIPCVDENGIPTSADCGLSTAEREFAGCVGAQCHDDASDAIGRLTTTTTRLRNLAEELHDLLVQVDANLDGPGGEIDGANPIFTAAEGAFFNLALAEFPEGERPDPRLLYAGSAAHNPYLMEQLLIASIDLVEETYNLQASPELNRERMVVPGR